VEREPLASLALLARRELLVLMEQMGFLGLPGQSDLKVNRALMVPLVTPDLWVPLAHPEYSRCSLYNYRSRQLV